MNSWKFLFVGVLVVGALLTSGLATSENKPTLDERVSAVLDDVDKASGAADRLEKARVLRDLRGKDLPGAIERAMDGRRALTRVSAYRELAHAGRRGKALAGLLGVLNEDNASLEAKREAAMIIGIAGAGRRSVLRAPLLASLDRATDVDLKIDLSRALWSICREVRAKEEVALFLGASQEAYRIKAALALGEMGEFQRAKTVLEGVALEPSVRGRLARAVLARERDLRAEMFRQRLEPPGDPEEDDDAIDTDTDILEKIIREIQRKYVDKDKTGRRRLEQAGVAYLMRSLDATCEYQTPETRALRERVAKLKGRLGMDLAVKGGAITIAGVLPGGVADRAGLRPLDYFTTIAKVKERDVFNLTLDDARLLLFGEPGTTVPFKVFRTGWKRAREMTLTREEDPAPKTRSAMLPGEALYLRPPVVDKSAAKDIDDLVAKRAPKSVVLDLRSLGGDDPAGLSAMAELFLPAGKLIAGIRGRSPEYGKKTEKRTKNPASITVPAVLLVDQGTRDMAEVLAAALSENKRARTVGITTFGRAAVHHVFPLAATGGKESLRLTVAQYTTPKDRVLFDRGFLPDREVEDIQRLDWMTDEMDKIVKAGLVEGYRKMLGDGAKKRIRELVSGTDGLDPKAWPKLDDVVKKADIKARLPLARQLAAEALRRAYLMEAGVYPDPYTDAQLQAAMLEVFAATGQTESRIAKRIAELLESRSNGDRRNISASRVN